VAGPGTGKTQVLTLRIANILLKTDTRPENILALTFTDAAATNMRRRLANLIGTRAYRVRIQTFHSFANDTLKTYPESFGSIVGSANITEVESTAIIEELVNDLPNLSLLRPWGDPMFYVRDIGVKISELKREGLSPKDFIKLIESEEQKFKSREDLVHEKGAHKGKIKSEHLKYERQLVKNRELGEVYEAYQKVLHERRLYDWSDMIMEVLKALETDPNLKLSLQEEHQYILVDEHQDTNQSQNKILEYLSDFHQNPNIFIVGDEKQAIFRFQGASAQNFEYVKKLYPNIVIIELFRNYRSSQPILDAAHSLIPSKQKLVGLESPLKLRGVREHLGSYKKISLVSCTTRTSELYFISEQIEKSIKEGTPPHEIAVLYRNNKDAFGIADILQKRGMKFTIESDEDLQSEKYVRKFLALLEAVHKYGNDLFLVPILHIEELGVDPLEAYRIIKSSYTNKKTLYESLEDNESTKSLSKLLKAWAKASKNDGLMEVSEKVLRESGLLNSMLSSKDADAFLGIERILEEGKRIAINHPGAELKDFMEYLGVLKKHNIFIKRPKHQIRSGFVRLMTVHRAKGLEFEEVYLLHASENIFGGSRMVEFLPLIPAVYKTENLGNRLDDERRLFYVALTRAKSKITISYPTTDENGKELLPSVFISELDEEKVAKVDTGECEERMAKHQELLYGESKNGVSNELDKDFVRELFQSQPLSVSALNNYLACPWKYFYRNLLRIPSIPLRHQLYGTAMHAAVQDLFTVRKDREVDVGFLLDSYKSHLGKSGLREIEMKEALERGSLALTGWFKWAHQTWVYPAIPEFSVTAHLEDILLSGKLDKVEFLSDERVAVTDYKTGRPKSKKEIEEGDVKRQLTFYKLLLNLHDPTSLSLRGAREINMQKGIIEFLEPTHSTSSGQADSGNYKKEEFEINDEETSELIETIKKVADEIINLKFWDQSCSEKTCEYCAYRKLLKS